MFKNWGAVEISTGNTFWCQNLKKASKSTKNAVFEGKPVEIYEVLQVEMSTIRYELSSSFTGKIMSFGLTVNILMHLDALL